MNTYQSFIESLNDVEVLTWWLLMAGWSAGLLFYLGLRYVAYRQCKPYYREVDARIAEHMRTYRARQEAERND